MSGDATALELVLSADPRLMSIVALSVFVSFSAVFFAALIGLPLGIALSYVLFRLFRLQMNFAFEVPWLAVGLCVLGTFAITFISMHYAASQIRRNNIAETMRAVNV